MSQSLSGSTALTTPTVSASSFAEIPYTWRVPGAYLEVKAAANENVLGAIPARGLVLGQLYAAGTATAGLVYPIYGTAQADLLFGKGSIIAKQCGAWLKVNPYTPLDAIGISDAVGSVKALGGVLVAGAATASGTLPLYFGGVRVATPVTVGDTAAVVAANMFAQLAMQGQSGYPMMPWLVPSYVAAGANVVLTAGHGGTLGNGVDIRACAQRGETIPAGLTVTITPMAGGATDPAAAINAALAGLVTTWYTDVAFAWTDPTNTSVFATWLTARYGAMVKLDAQGYVGLGGTYGTILAYLPNCKFLTILPMQNPLAPPLLYAAAMAAACAYESAKQPAKQMKTVPLPGIQAPADADIFTLNEREVLLQSGFSTYYADSTGTVYVERATTSFRFDATGVPNTQWFDLKNVKVPTRVRYDWNTFCGQQWPRNNLTNDGTLAASFDPDAVTPSILQASWTSRSALYEKAGWIQNSAVTAKASVFTIDANDGNRVNSRQQINIMGSLMELCGSLEFISNN